MFTGNGWEKGRKGSKQLNNHKNLLKGLLTATVSLSLIAGPVASAQPVAPKPAASKPVAHAKGSADVDGARLLAADSEPGTWMASGRFWGSPQIPWPVMRMAP